MSGNHYAAFTTAGVWYIDGDIQSTNKITTPTVEATNVKITSSKYDASYVISPGTASPGSTTTGVTLEANKRYMFVVWHESNTAMCGVYILTTSASAITNAKIINAENISIVPSGLTFKYKNNTASGGGTANGRLIYLG